MGMLNALLDIGKVLGGDELECATKMPLSSGVEIRIWLDVEDPAARPLRVRGVARVDFARIRADRKRSYFFRAQEGSNFHFCYSPVVRMQLKELSFDEPYRNKLATRVLGDLESPNCDKGNPSVGPAVQVFEQGSVARIMKGLQERRDELIRLGKDLLDEGKRNEQKVSFLLVFGVQAGDRFAYPGDPPIRPLFCDYFWFKLGSVLSKGGRARCALCGEEEEHAVNLDQVFAFATFDKKSFLPGGYNASGTPEKVFPLCRGCLRWLTRGKDHADALFRDDRTAHPLHLTVIPELFGYGPGLGRRTLEAKTKDFLETGLTNASGLSEVLLEQDDVLAYHFLFWEQIKDQERIHLMVEDVPPLRLARLLYAWKRSCLMFPEIRRSRATMGPGERQSLSEGMRFVFGVLGSFAEKNKQDQKALRDLALAVTGKLLHGERVDLAPIKGIVCARLSGLLTDPTKPMKERGFPVRRAERLVDFLARVNRLGHDGEEEDQMSEETMCPEKAEAGPGMVPRKPLRERVEEMLEGFADPYLKEPFGRGVFLAGVVLGFFAQEQVGKGGDLASAPLFKQLNFGRLRRRDLQERLGRLPGLIYQYHVPHAGAIRLLTGEVTRLLLEGTPRELGSEGNFAFAAGFLSASSYFWRCFGEKISSEEIQDDIPREETLLQEMDEEDDDV